MTTIEKLRKDNKNLAAKNGMLKEHNLQLEEKIEHYRKERSLAESDTNRIMGELIRTNELLSSKDLTIQLLATKGVQEIIDDSRFYMDFYYEHVDNSQK